MKFTQQTSVSVGGRFIFQNAPSVRPEGELQAPEVIAETIGDLETVEAAVMADLRASLEAVMQEGRDPNSAVVALSDLLGQEDVLSAEDFRTQFNEIWARVPDNLKTQINNTVLIAAESIEPPMEVSSERQAELTTFLTEARPVFETLNEITTPDINFGRFYDELFERLDDPSIATQVENLQSIYPVLEWSAENTDVISALNENEEFQALATSNEFLSRQQVEVLMALQTALEGVTDPAERSSIVEAQLNNLPDPEPQPSAETTETGPLEALLNSVPESMQSMFATEYAAWENHLLEGGARISFNDYLIQQANGDEGRLRTIQIKMQLSSIIEMLRPIFEALRSLRGDTEEPEDELTPEAAAAEQLRADRITAAERGVPLEQIQMERRVAEFQTYFNGTNAPVIAEFFNMDVEPPVFDAERAQAFLDLPANAEVDLASIQNIETTIKANTTAERATSLLRQGLSLQALNAIANLPANAISNVTETGITLGEEGTEIPFAPATDFNTRLEAGIRDFRTAQTAAAAEVREASENLVKRNEFIQAMATRIKTQAEAENWSQNAYIDDHGENGFYWSGETLMVDMDDDRGLGIDWGGSNLELFDRSEFPFADNGYATEAEMVTDLATVLKDKKVRQLAPADQFNSSIE